MKFTPEVVAALEVLRAAAENDFERHRIDVLEKDLREPPKVEQIDEKHQSFDGMLYNKHSKGYYSITRTIHRIVWGYYFGDIPNDYHIHHIDGNPENNEISNLQLLPADEHHRLHVEKGNQFPSPIRAFVCANCGKVFEAPDHGRNRFCSRECQIKKNHEESLETRTCIICGQTFFARRYEKTKCCSRKCGNVWGARQKKQSQ